MQQGVIDPTKVVRFALQNASSVAGLMLTTDAMVAELVEEKGAGGHSPACPAWAAWATWTCKALRLRQKGALRAPFFLRHSSA